MPWTRARGTSRRAAALVGAALLIAAIAPLPATAAAPAKPKFASLTALPARTVGRVNALAASHLAPRHVPAKAQLPKLALPRSAKTTPKNSRAPKIATPLVVATPPLSVTHTTFTQSLLDVLTEPPDPWVVANGSYVLSSSNGVVRVMNRSGSVLGNIPTFALFDTDVAHAESDPRILWDAAHSRWVGVVVTYDYPTFIDNSLTLAVSDTSNPLGTWTIHRLDYLDELPDYPGIASTKDKIVLTSNLFLNGDTLQGSAFQVVAWSSLLTGGTSASAPEVCAACLNLRPARSANTAVATAYVVYEDSDLGHVSLLSLTGTVSPVIGFDQDLGIAAGVDPFDHNPRQPGGTFSDQAVDSRIPDAVVSGDTVYFARTGEADQGGAGLDLVIQAYTTSIAAASAGTPTYTLSTFGAKDEDYWMAGVGVSAGDASAGTAYFLTYMRSSDTLAPAAYAMGSLDGAAFTDPKLVASSSTSYSTSGLRWGDYMGITPDPSGTMAAWSATEVVGPDGGWQQVVDRLVLDDTAPTTPGTPTQGLVAGTQLTSTTVPVKVSWAAASDPQSGIRNYFVGEGPFASTAVVAGTSYVAKVPAFTYGDPGAFANDFTVAAVNDVGIGGAFSSWSTPLTAQVFEQTRANFHYSSGWGTSSNSVYTGGSTKYSRKVGASVTFRTNGRSFAWVTYRGANRGKAKVYVDGVYKGTYSLTSSVSKARYIPYAITFSSYTTHSIKIVVASGRVDVDAFVVLR